VIVNLLGLPPLRIQVSELVRTDLATEPRLAAAERNIAELQQRIVAIDAFLQDEVTLKGLPFPPGRLIEAVAAVPLVTWFYGLGKSGAESITAVLRQHGLDIASFERILDFGCGCGRVIRHWSPLTRTDVHGTDYNVDLIDWCRANLGFAHFGVNQLTPPLTYADNSFDFVYALSVFTHLAEDTQQAWMRELGRVLKPGGHLLITTHGDFYLPMLTDDERRRYQGGELVLRSAMVEGSNECAAFQSESHVRSTLAAGWTVVAAVPEGSLGTPRQDLYLLRKP
jgi:SAM-dependent methyltransferase